MNTSFGIGIPCCNFNSWRAEFEDGLWIVDQLMASNGLQRGLTIIGVLPGGNVHAQPDSSWGRLNSYSGLQKNWWFGQFTL